MNLRRKRTKRLTTRKMMTTAVWTILRESVGKELRKECAHKCSLAVKRSSKLTTR
jgi:hypothetical protein